MIVNTQSHQFVGNQQIAIEKRQRSSNLELYRIICMFLIVAHHYFANSGLSASGLLNQNTSNSIFLHLFGAWGKTGINCFMMITGYFMCTSKITLRKFVKLMAQVYFYRWLLFPIFLIAGYETLSLPRLARLVMPFWGISDGFTSCFIAFWLMIPFLSILVQNMNQRQHQLLLILLLGIYTVLGSAPTFNITFNYVTWFCIIFFIGSYIRLYPHPLFNRKCLWGWLTLANVILAMASIVIMHELFSKSYYFVSDCHKFFAVAIAVSSFLWFKNMNIKYSKVINAFGAATFGVLLIHANSNAMRTWLWVDTVDVVGHYSLPLGQLVLFSFGIALAVFLVCNLIDQMRIATLEKWFFNWYDNKLSAKADAFVNKITKN